MTHDQEAAERVTQAALNLNDEVRAARRLGLRVDLVITAPTGLAMEDDPSHDYVRARVLRHLMENVLP